MKRFSAIAALAVVTLIGCGKDVGIGDPNEGAGVGIPGGPSAAAPMPTCGPDRAVSWRFVQPQAQVNRSVDLLIVMDSSTSLSPERDRIASNIPSFIGQLPADTDYRVAVMLAHGGASSFSGRLYSPAGVPKVLSSQSHTLNQSVSYLRQTLSRSVADTDEADGETLFYSALKSLEPARLTQIRSQDFYRDDAALAVAFVSDENDVCFRPQDHGFTAFPHYVPSTGGVEEIAYQRYCSGVSGSSVLSKFRAFKATRSVSFAAITFIDPSRVQRVSEDAVGHGLIELVQETSDGVLADLADTSYAEGLARLGSVVSVQLKLKTLFALAGGQGVQPTSVIVAVDGRKISHRFDEAATAVEIAQADAGGAGSVVDVVGCK